MIGNWATTKCKKGNTNGDESLGKTVRKSYITEFPKVPELLTWHTFGRIGLKYKWE